MDYSSYGTVSPPPLAGKPAKKDRFTTFAFFGMFLGIVVIGTVVAFALANAFPTKIRALLLTLDQFGLTAVGANEQSRIRAINQLQITHEEKTVLINRTVFLGASPIMVRLALGEPACINQHPATKEYDAYDQWVYFMESDPKPTHLLFQKGQLVNAGKASAYNSCAK